MDGALASLFSALDSNGDGKLVCFIFHFYFINMPSVYSILFGKVVIIFETRSWISRAAHPNSKKQNAEEMCFLGKAVLGTMPTPEAAKKEIGKAAGANAKECTKDQFLKYASGGLGKCSDGGDATEAIKFWTERVKSAQKRAKEAAKGK